MSVSGYLLRMLKESDKDEHKDMLGHIKFYVRYVGSKGRVPTEKMQRQFRLIVR